MEQDLEPVVTGVARPVGQAGPEWAPEPLIVTPVRNTTEWEWSQQLRPPAITGSVQEKWAKAAIPIRAFALFLLWITWHWTRVAALALVVSLVAVLIIIK